MIALVVIVLGEDMQVSPMENEIGIEAKRLVQCMSVQCPCGNWIFVGMAGHLRRSNDVRFWPELKCPNCVEPFSATQQNLQLVSVPLFVFERGYCGPEAIKKS